MREQSRRCTINNRRLYSAFLRRWLGKGNIRVHTLRAQRQPLKLLHWPARYFQTNCQLNYDSYTLLLHCSSSEAHVHGCYIWAAIQPTRRECCKLYFLVHDWSLRYWLQKLIIATGMNVAAGQKAKGKRQKGYPRQMSWIAITRMKRCESIEML